VSPGQRTQRIAGWLIQAICRRLPADVRAERCREWTAELPAILDDQSVRPSFLRTLRAFSFCLGISWTTRQLSRSARAASRRTRNAQWHTGAMRIRPAELAVRAVRGLLIWLAVVAVVLGLLIALLHARGLPPSLPVMLVLALAVGFDGFCLADIARAERVRYLHKWVWVVICLVQAPLGGIMYLSIGHIGRDPSRRGN
jgi:Phospholipase_D-nuclease N-terminal